MYYSYILILIIILIIILIALGADLINEEADRQELLALQAKKDADISGTKQELEENAIRKGKHIRYSNTNTNNTTLIGVNY